jgi:hypothetical protein
MANTLISDNHHLLQAKQGVMLDLNLVDLEMDLISNHILKSTLLLDRVLQQWMNTIIVMLMVILMPRLLVMPRRDMGILTVKRTMDMIMVLQEVTITDTRTVVVVTRMDR